jgi:hypothetical protein
MKTFLSLVLVLSLFILVAVPHAMADTPAAAVQLQASHSQDMTIIPSAAVEADPIY